MAPDHSTVPGVLSPESWKDVAWVGGLTDRSAGMTGGGAVGGEDGCRGASSGDAGTAMMVAGSRADVMVAGSRAVLTVLRVMRVCGQAEGVVCQGFNSRSSIATNQGDGKTNFLVKKTHNGWLISMVLIVVDQSEFAMWQE